MYNAYKTTTKGITRDFNAISHPYGRLAKDSFMNTLEIVFSTETILGFKEKVYLKTFPPF